MGKDAERSYCSHLPMALSAGFFILIVKILNFYLHQPYTTQDLVFEIPKFTRLYQFTN